MRLWHASGTCMMAIRQCGQHCLNNRPEVTEPSRAVTVRLAVAGYAWDRKHYYLLRSHVIVSVLRLIKTRLSTKVSSFALFVREMQIQFFVSAGQRIPCRIEDGIYPQRCTNSSLSFILSFILFTDATKRVSFLLR